VAELADDSSGGWVNVSELARLRGVDKAAISRRVARLEELRALTTRLGPRGSKLINVSEFARAVEQLTDTVREANGRHSGAARGPKVANGGDLSLGQEQARKTAKAADLLEIQLSRLQGELVRISDFSAGATMRGETLARVIDRLADRAEDLAVVVAKDGAAGLRSALRGVARELRSALADAFAALAEAPGPVAGETAEAEPEEFEASA